MQVGVDGSWKLVRYNNVTNNVDVRFARGFVQPSQSYTISADINGPVMTFTINQHTVATISDATYPDSYGISFGLSDAGAKEPPSALFSHFAYTPLSDSPQEKAVEASSTATAQVNAASSEATTQPAYSAPIPGFGCDHGPGQWQPVNEADQYVTTHCLSHALNVTQREHSKNMGRISFYGLDGNFPSNYSVKVGVDLKKSNNNWAGLSTRVNEQGASYTFLVRNDGNWSMRRYDDRGASHQLAAGRVARHDSYILEAVTNEETLSLQINGGRVASVHDAFLSTTDHIELNTLSGSKSPPGPPTSQTLACSLCLDASLHLL
ncbi:hypothetical protein [Dictyobacter kobayashii]|uniref:Uncharacterized protein n=1 Tax=Dictyobacter kobayashii TaxID=2014872 RepID=A0A402ARM4_9CHLR|nr:hypothetical protein [Dictyobacter kobayashii]GCE21761.1 hypothetical protein KDK_55610 [Dictyobacter kobayashii]